jgi:hypothetical protein
MTIRWLQRLFYRQPKVLGRQDLAKNRRQENRPRGTAYETLVPAEKLKMKVTRGSNP